MRVGLRVETIDGDVYTIPVDFKSETQFDVAVMNGFADIINLLEEYVDHEIKPDSIEVGDDDFSSDEEVLEVDISC